MKPHTITTQLERDTDGTWYYVHMPKEIRSEYKSLEKRGAIPVTVTIGQTTWEATMLPWADGSSQISVAKKVREKENLQLGRDLSITVEPRDRT